MKNFWKVLACSAVIIFIGDILECFLSSMSKVEWLLSMLIIFEVSRTWKEIEEKT